ncbi:hypothetical protein ACOTFF_14160 [Achromobacter xylosoxidans]
MVDIAMHEWRRALVEGIGRGAVASGLSTLALIALAHRQTGRPAAATNATSQWIWGEPALRADAPSWRHTVPGYLIHHAASVFWAVLHARARRSAPLRDTVVPAWAEGAAVAAVACFADYVLTPRRFRPGFEHRLSRGALLVVYAAFGLGIALALPKSRARPTRRR